MNDQAVDLLSKGAFAKVEEKLVDPVMLYQDLMKQRTMLHTNIAPHQVGMLNSDWLDSRVQEIIEIGKM